MLRNSNAGPLSLVFGCIAIVAIFAGPIQAQKIVLTNSNGNTLEVEIGDDKEKDDRVPVDVAILLDTSNSMDGLISQARNQLWQIVTRLSETEKDGRKPALRVSVFEYGNTRLPATENYLRQVLPLSDDLDKVSEALFALTTNGGDEYCGAVIGEAVKRLDWSSDSDAYKSIFIAGNEAFTQGQISYLNTCADAKEKNIIVNTIHCGDHSTGVNGMWADGAEKGGGKNFNIDQDQKRVSIPCPQDKILIELNTKLNKTYLWFGSKKSRGSNSRRQIAQDAEAFNGWGSGYKRSLSKASGIYDNRSRDLVDGASSGSIEIESLDAELLPEEMQKLNVEERKKYVADNAAKRKEIQEQIKQVAKDREAYLKTQLAKDGKDKNTLGDVIVEALDEQLDDLGFEASK